MRYFAIKFDLFMFSNIFDIISTFTVELKVFVVFLLLLFYQYNTNKMAACVNMKYSPKTILNDDFVENQFQIALIIHRLIDKKNQSRLLYLKGIKEGFDFATLGLDFIP